MADTLVERLTGQARADDVCAACNHAKQAPGWAARAAPDGSVVTHTSTGHRYVSGPRSPVELRLQRALVHELDAA